MNNILQLLLVAIGLLLLSARPGQARSLEEILATVNPLASQPTKELESLVTELLPLEDQATSEQKLDIDLLKMRYYAIRGNFGATIDLIQKFDDPSIPPEYRVRAYTIAIPVYHMRGDYTSGFKFLIKIQQLLPWVKDKTLKHIAMSKAPDMYIESGDLDRALSLAKESLQLAETTGSPDNICDAYDTLSGIYLKIGSYDKALQGYNQMRHYCEMSSLVLATGMAHAGIGSVLEAQQRFREALPEFETALKLTRETGYQYGISYSLVHLANVHLALGNTERANTLVEEALPLLESTGQTPVHATAYKVKSGLAEQQGDYKAALHWFKKKSAADKQIMDNRKAIRIAQLQVEFELKNKEQHIEQLTQENRLLALQEKTTSQRSLIIILGLVIAGLIVVLLWLKAQRERSHFEHMSQVDPLTGLYNHAYCYSLAEESFHECKRQNRSFTVIVADIDWFKYVNDTYGHAAGDKVLQHIASVLKTCLGQEGIVGRTGGEEFTCFLPGRDIDQAMELVENCRQQVHPVVDYGKSIEVTLSYGLAQARGDYNTLDTLVRDADEALYKAKRNGRNQVLAYLPPHKVQEA